MRKSANAETPNIILMYFSLKLSAHSFQLFMYYKYVYEPTLFVLYTSTEVMTSHHAEKSGRNDLIFDLVHRINILLLLVVVVIFNCRAVMPQKPKHMLQIPQYNPNHLEN